MFVLGIDLGTSSCKVVLVNQAGQIIRSSTSTYSLSTPKPLWSEQNPDDWWKAVIASIREITQDYPARDITGIGLSGQMSGLVLLDNQNCVLYPAILWNDGRSQQDCDTLSMRFPNIIRETGNYPVPGLVAPKLLWFQCHEPHLWKKVRTILLPKDYLRFKLTGEKLSDMSDGSLTQLMDVKNRRWSPRVLEACEIDEGYLGALIEGCDVGGYISSEAASSTGLYPGIPVVGGAGDQPAAAIGVGCVFPSQTLVSLGTSGVVLSVTDGYKENSEKGLNNCCHALPHTWFQMGVMLSAAGSLQWYRDTCAVNLDFLSLCEATKNIPAGSEGLVFLPHLTGERTPYCDPYARGAFIGLSRRHHQAHLSRAVLEGIGMGLFQSLKLIQQTGISIKEAIVNGSGTKSDVWVQILADIFNITLIRTNNADVASALGAARLALMGCHKFSVKDVCQADHKSTTLFYPHSESAKVYQEKIKKFEAIYPLLKECRELNVA